MYLAKLMIDVSLTAVYSVLFTFVLCIVLNAGPRPTTAREISIEIRCCRLLSVKCNFDRLSNHFGFFFPYFSFLSHALD